MSEKLDKVKRGLECCSNGLFCEDDCPYAEIRDSDGPEDNCIAALARDALEVLKAQEPRPPNIFTKNTLSMIGSEKRTGA